MKQIEVKIPNGYMNISVTTDNNLVGDTNDSTNWGTFKFPLPSGTWSIEKYIKGNSIVILNQIEESKLEEAANKYWALEGYGVDNWVGYSDAMESLEEES